MPIIRSIHQTFPPDEVEAIAAKMAAEDEDGWTYEPVHDPKGTGNSIIKVYDEEGEFVHNL